MPLLLIVLILNQALDFVGKICFRIARDMGRHVLDEEVELYGAGAETGLIYVVKGAAERYYVIVRNVK